MRGGAWQEPPPDSRGPRLGRSTDHHLTVRHGRWLPGGSHFLSSFDIVRKQQVFLEFLLPILPRGSKTQSPALPGQTAAVSLIKDPAAAQAAAVAQVRSSAWELPHAAGVAKKKLFTF